VTADDPGVARPEIGRILDASGQLRRFHEHNLRSGTRFAAGA
jgi:hypothetical protein